MIILTIQAVLLEMHFIRHQFVYLLIKLLASKLESHRNAILALHISFED